MHKYFCNSCGHRFTSDTPEYNESGLLNDIPCPECGCWDVFPDAPAGSAQAIAELTNYENIVEVGE